MTKSYVRPGYATLTAGLNLKNPDLFIDWAKRALGAEIVMRFATPDGIARHCAMRIGDSTIAIDAAVRDPETRDALFHVYVPDADAAYARAIEAGSKPKMPPADMFFGERVGAVTDPFGNHWNLAMFVREVSDAELQKGAAEMMARMQGR